jgi:diguanylate cyclase (GGDEF)-like protein
MNPPTRQTQPTRIAWRDWIVGLGRWRAVLAITLFSVVASLLIVVSVGHWLEFSDKAMAISIKLAILVPAFVAPMGSVMVVVLAFELENTRALMDDLARRDFLTQVFNRRYFHERFESDLNRAQREGQPLALLMIDADNFKALNDTHGHAAGDEALRQLARACATCLRPYDVLARYGGEEFVALLPSASAAQALEVAERVRLAVSGLTLQSPTGATITVTVSVGVASCQPTDMDGTALLSGADKALYRAKQAGRNRCSD